MNDNDKMSLFLFVYLAAIFPVVQKQHQLLVTLLLCNAASMEVDNWKFCFSTL